MIDFLSIAYITSRRDCRIKWFFDSLHNQTEGHYSRIKIIVVDFHADLPGRRNAFAGLAHSPITHVPPKPTPWQGKHRLTNSDYFAASNSRNTAVCYAPDGFIAYLDDLSVLLPGWLKGVKRAIHNGYIALGAYRKVLNLDVSNGRIKRYIPFEPGIDSRTATFTRLAAGSGDPIKVAGSWLFGSNVVMPVRDLLRVNGWDEDCDSMGMEDVVCGMMMERHGSKFFYDLKMMTYEAEELHHTEPPMIRLIKPYPGEKDSSHAILNWVLHDRNRAPNTFNLNDLRNQILEGGTFPTEVYPKHDWRDGMPLCEMP